MMKRTTIVADEELLLEIKQLAVEENQTVNNVIANALREYIKARRRRTRGRISFIGMGDSGRDDLSEKIEDIIAADPRRHEDD